jgi:hypothetical protein
MEKYNMLLTKSNPERVYQKFVEFGLDRFSTIEISPNKNKKYVVQLKSNGKKIHFGDIRYQDFTFHQDEIRRDNFMRRNHRWADAEVFTSMWLSFFLLW